MRHRQKKTPSPSPPGKEREKKSDIQSKDLLGDKGQLFSGRTSADLRWPKGICTPSPRSQDNAISSFDILIHPVGLLKRISRKGNLRIKTKLTQLLMIPTVMALTLSPYKSFKVFLKIHSLYTAQLTATKDVL